MNIDREKSIVFIGFMGAGKTTIGKLVAEKLNRKFIDIDEEIEKEFNMPVSQVFKEFGEKAFRDREKNLITSLSQQKGLIISVGGGAFLQEDIKKVCLSSSIVIFLDLAFESWKDRISLILDSRPVLQGKSLEEMKELFYHRQKIYADHHLKIQTDNKNPEDIANQVIKKIKGTITISNLTIGEGPPKICTPLVGKSISELKDEALFIKTIDVDIVEWRVDFFEQVEDILKVKEALKEIRTALSDIPLIFTFRSANEGGEKEVSNQAYFELNKAVAETGLVDIIDVELFNEEIIVKSLIEVAHSNSVLVIISNHDFEKTPPKEEIVSRLRKAQEMGGDLPKIAVMPARPADVLTLLDATNTMKEKYADRPIITMSMAGQGVISRIAGEVFGSAITFGAAKKASAPGQVPVNDLRKVLEILHSNS